MLHLRSHLLAAVFLSLLPHGLHAQGTSPAELEARLPGLTGAERARTLAKLVDAYKLDEPDRALAHGAEALRLFREHPDPGPQVSTLNEMGWAQMTLGRYDSARVYLERARDLGRHSGERTGEARALSNLGSLNQRMGDPRAAVALFTQALAIQREVGSQANIAGSLNNLGFVYSTDLADYDRSLALHLEALAIRERLGDKAAIALSLNNIGIVHGRLRQYDRSLAYLRRALDLRRELGNKARVAATLNNMGDVYLEMGDLPRALSYQRQALDLRTSLDDPSAIALSHRNLGMVYLAMRRHDAARAALRRALHIGDQVGDKGLAVQNLLGLAAVEREGGRPGEAETYAKRALAVAEQMGSREMIRRATEELASAQEARGEMETALRTLRRSKALSDSIFTVETSRRIAELEQRFAEERRAHEMERLRRSEAVARLQATRRAAQRNATAGIALLLAVVGALLYRQRVERARLAEAASVTDALTGAKNRRYLEQTIAMDVAASLRRHRGAAARGETPHDADLLFFLLDLDHFKKVNDELGHAAGDRVLVSVAETLRTAVRDSDVLVRWGGEEFLVLARFSDRAHASAAAERLRRAVEGQATTLPGGRTLGVTCSIGFAAFPFDPASPDALGWEEVLAIADAGAYTAKREGRNRSAGYSRGTGAPVPPPSGWRPGDLEALVAEAQLHREASPATIPAMAIFGAAAPESQPATKG